jgi:hypothetical protein
MAKISWRRAVKFHDVQIIDFSGPNMMLQVDGQTYLIDLASVSPRLAQAQDAVRRSYSISPSGYGVHWPCLDEDITIDGLIASAHNIGQKAREVPLVLKDQPPQ